MLMIKHKMHIHSTFTPDIAQWISMEINLQFLQETSNVEINYSYMYKVHNTVLSWRGGFKTKKRSNFGKLPNLHLGYILAYLRSFHFSLGWPLYSLSPSLPDSLLSSTTTHGHKLHRKVILALAQILQWPSYCLGHPTANTNINKQVDQAKRKVLKVSENWKCPNVILFNN